MLDAAGCRTMRVERASDGDALRARGVACSALGRERSEAEPEAAAMNLPSLAEIAMERRRRRMLPEPTQRTLTELLTRLLVSHAGELIAAPAGSDADER